MSIHGILWNWTVIFWCLLLWGPENIVHFDCANKVLLPKPYHSQFPTVFATKTVSKTTRWDGMGCVVVWCARMGWDGMWWDAMWCEVMWYTVVHPFSVASPFCSSPFLLSYFPSCDSSYFSGFSFLFLFLSVTFSFCSSSFLLLFLLPFCYSSLLFLLLFSLPFRYFSLLLSVTLPFCDSCPFVPWLFSIPSCHSSFLLLFLSIAFFLRVPFSNSPDVWESLTQKFPD